MDNKEKFIALWEEAGGERAEKGILKKIAKKLKVPEGTIRRWKSEHIKKNKVNVRRSKNPLPLGMGSVKRTQYIVLSGIIYR